MAMTEMKQRELIEHWSPWLRSVARRFPPMMPSRIEDLAQEGWIAIWRGLQILDTKSPEDMPDSIDKWLKRCAVNRMHNVVNSWTCEGRNAYTAIGIDYQSLDNPTETTSPFYDALYAALSVNLGDIEMAYHHGEIMDAINRLPKAQKAYVLRKFWHGWSPTALDIYFNDAKYTWRAAKTQLSEELAHLHPKELIKS